MKNKLLKVISVGSIFIAAVIATASALSKLDNPPQESSSNYQKQLPAKVNSDEDVPIVDYLAAEPGDPGELAKRKMRGKKYEKAIMPIEPVGSGVLSTLSTHWDRNLTSLPADQSNLVAIGTVSDAQAFLSPNKVSVYSEFTVDVEKVFKNDVAKLLAPGEQITIERQGGRVRIPNGAIHRYVVAGQRFPHVGRRYIFFLSRNNGEDKYFHILTAYELRPGQVFPLDSALRFKDYEGADETRFLNEVQSAIATSLSKPK